MGKKITSIVLFIAVSGVAFIYSMHSEPKAFSLSGNIDSIETDMRKVMNRLVRFNVDIDGQSFEDFITECHYLEKLVGINISECLKEDYYSSKISKKESKTKVGKLNNLEELSLKWKGLRKIPDAIIQLKNLKKLDLNYNYLNGEDSLKGIERLYHLEELSLGWNDLKSLSPMKKVWFKLSQLKVLYIGGNYLSMEDVALIKKKLEHTEVRGLQSIL